MEIKARMAGQIASGRKLFLAGKGGGQGNKDTSIAFPEVAGIRVLDAELPGEQWGLVSIKGLDLCLGRWAGGP